MDELQVTRRNFTDAKANIKKFSDTIPAVVISKFEKKKGFLNLFSNGVSIESLNSFVAEVQNNLIKSNDIKIKIIQQFSEVYKALEGLDKGYIQSIILSLKATEKANERALKASADANDAQKDITRTIEGLKITVSKLNQFKDEFQDGIDDLNIKIENIGGILNASLHKFEQVEGIYDKIENYMLFDGSNSIFDELNNQKEKYENLIKTVKELELHVAKLQLVYNVVNEIVHLCDIDVMWNDFQAVKTKLFDNNIKLSELETSLSHLVNYKEKLDLISHLWDIDSMWNFVQQHGVDIQGIESKISTTDKQITSLENYKSKLESFTHLDDIDSTWDYVEQHKVDIQSMALKISSADKQITSLENYKSKLESFTHLDDIDSTWDYVEQHKVDIQSMALKISSADKQIISLENYKSKLERLAHLEDIDILWIDVHSNKQKIVTLTNMLQELINRQDNFSQQTNQNLDSLQQVVHRNNQLIEKKLKIVYVLMGIFALVLILQFIAKIMYDG